MYAVYCLKRATLWLVSDANRGLGGDRTYGVRERVAGRRRKHLSNVEYVWCEPSERVDRVVVRQHDTGKVECRGHFGGHSRPLATSGPKCG